MKPGKRGENRCYFCGLFRPWEDLKMKIVTIDDPWEPAYDDELPACVWCLLDPEVIECIDEYNWH
ncbi:hypothetical protein MYX07_07210 [Patescibacteria group bacterium AH-259-L07]|nr:hypothetical protein [Patescibacteria group bacterium AH-259-L07]